MSELLEAMMVIAFGVSWPLNIVKSLRSRTAKGKSLWFMVLILFGYICGIVSKLTADRALTYVFAFYIINFIMVSVDLILYFRNRKLDKLAEQQ